MPSHHDKRQSAQGAVKGRRKAPGITAASPPSGSWIHHSPEVGPGKARFTVICACPMVSRTLPAEGGPLTLFPTPDLPALAASSLVEHARQDLPRAVVSGTAMPADWFFQIRVVL